MTAVFDVEAVREWADYRPGRSRVVDGRVVVEVPVVVWTQVLSDLAACVDEIERLGGASWPYEIVYWEDDPGRSRVVKRACRACYPKQDMDMVVLVGPSGVAHHADGDTTLCGKDATGPDWWWHL